MFPSLSQKAHSSFPSPNCTVPCLVIRTDPRSNNPPAARRVDSVIHYHANLQWYHFCFDQLCARVVQAGYYMRVYLAN